MKIARRQWLAAAAGTAAGLALAPQAQAQEESKLTFEMYQDGKEEYRWRLKAGNGQVIATGGQGYKAKADCKHAIDVIQKGAAGAKVVEAAPAKKE